MDSQQEKQLYKSEEPHARPSSNKPISWTASEYITHEKTQVWYVVYLSGSIGITAFIYLVLKDVLAAVAVLLAAVSAGFFASRPPASKKYELSSGKLLVGPKSYNLDDFKSYSVVEEGAIDSIWLKPLGRISPILIIYFSPKDENKITDMLSQYLPYEPRELDNVSKITKRLRF